ncbi:MAG: L-aspartate oxidase, partial [Candidatus Micrarchaeota archaeon]
METDILVVGSGIAGLTLALKASKLGKVTIVTKANAFTSNTSDAQGGIAIPISKADAERHISDTLKAGRGICDELAVRMMVGNAGARILELSDWGVKFEREGDDFKRTLEAGHSSSRIVYNQDATGKAIEHKLVTLARENKNIEIMEDTAMLDLITAKGKCLGVQALSPKSSLQNIASKFTILATGGLGQIYEKTTNPTVATGDGYAAAARAGAVLENMEFVQFHPTKLDVPSMHPFLMSEVMRGEGGRLVDADGKPFMAKYAREGELAPRDVVARAIFIESQKGRVYLDMTHRKRSFLKSRFPTIYAKCFGYDIDLAEDLAPVVAAAHYMCGGVRTDLHARTSIRNLYAIGEVACTGVHGANRLASNSLLEAMVFSHEAFLDLGRNFSKSRMEKAPAPEIPKKGTLDLSFYELKIRKLMWEKVGLVRSREGLISAISELEKTRKFVDAIWDDGLFPGLLQLRGMVEASMLVAKAALARKKSLGCH